MVWFGASWVVVEGGWIVLEDLRCLMLTEKNNVLFSYRNNLSVSLQLGDSSRHTLLHFISPTREDAHILDSSTFDGFEFLFSFGEEEMRSCAR
jgi:hypothetical protein